MMKYILSWIYKVQIIFDIIIESLFCKNVTVTNGQDELDEL